MLFKIFIELSSTWNPTFIRVRKVRWCVHTGQYISSSKQILFFSYFHRISSNRYLFFPDFHIVSMLLTIIWPYGLLSWCLYSESGGGDGYLESDFWQKSLYHIQSLCPLRQGKSAKCGHPADTGRKLNVHKTFRRRPKLLMYVQFTSCVYWAGDGESKITDNVRTSFMDGPCWYIEFCVGITTCTWQIF